MFSRDTAPSSTFMNNWSGSILRSRNRPMYRCNKYRQHLFWMFSVQKLNHDIVWGTCKVVCGVYVIFVFSFLTHDLCTIHNIHYTLLSIVYCVEITHAYTTRCPGLGVQTLVQIGIHAHLNGYIKSTIQSTMIGFLFCIRANKIKTVSCTRLLSIVSDGV